MHPGLSSLSRLSLSLLARGGYFSPGKQRGGSTQWTPGTGVRLSQEAWRGWEGAMAPEAQLMVWRLQGSGISLGSGRDDLEEDSLGRSWC